MALKVHKISGEMPQCWERSVIFFANLLSLFFGNETETDVLRKEVGPLESYGSRLVPIINLLFKGSDNLLVLEKDPEPALLSYFQDRLKLSLPQTIVVPHDVYKSINAGEDNYHPEVGKLIDYLKSLPAQWLDGYVTDSTLEKLAETIGKRTISSFAGSRHGNNKLLLHEFLKTTGFPVFDTLIVQSMKELSSCLEQLQKEGYSFAVIKSEIGASGIGMQKIELNGAYKEVSVPEYLFFEGPCIVQGWLDESVYGIHYIGSPSVQLFLDDQAISIFDVTDQILSKDSVHEGNIAPPPYLLDDSKTLEEMLLQAQEVGQWLHGQGYRGTGSVDFHIIERDNKREVRVCEINARVTGATYPSILARHLMPKGAWLMRNIRFDPGLNSVDIIDILEENGLLYIRGEKKGILPFNFNPNAQGNILKGQFLFLADTGEEAYVLLKKLSEVSSLKGNYDRD